MATKALFGQTIIKTQIDDPYFINESNLQINFTAIIGTGASSTVYKGFLIGSSPLYTTVKLIETQKFQDCEVVIKV
uniref:Uncharacterized protein n=1 Tax=Acrobeloides nanus TaxID=290746 RepID=A0A914DT06_9BILA